jgi:hypothetical protein
VMSTLGKRLIKAAKEGRAISRGEADPATYKTFVPAKIDVKAIRAQDRSDAGRIQHPLRRSLGELARLGAMPLFPRSHHARVSDDYRS